MKHKTYYVASDEPDLQPFDQHVLHLNLEDAVEEWVDGYETEPNYIFKVEVTQRAKVARQEISLNWETESGAS